jgi:chromate reductase, NAD(P)H dehydrogenase (quinone)
MSDKQKVAVMVGSLRKGAFSRMTAQVLMANAPEGLDCRIVEIGELPIYNQDLDAAPPTAWVVFRDQIKASDAVLFVTPEYNRSMPGALKNAVDVGSRPYGQSVWNGKPGAVMTISPGAIGGFGANHHLRQSLVFLNVPMMLQPEAYVGGIGGVFDEAGNVKNEGTLSFFRAFMESFAKWVAVHAPR